MDRTTDTIAALSTPVGTAALAVIRVTGPACGAIARAIFGPKLVPRFAHHGDYVDRNGVIVDDVVTTFFAGPNSYTGEDMLEISTHGNPLIAQRVLEDLFKRGCRSAAPGEFTRRAFSNGRLDLSQAEAVIDLIAARSERALAAANQQLRGSLGRHLSQLTEELLAGLARIEAYIDFPEDDLPAEDRALVNGMLERALGATQRLLATEHYGTLLRDGIKTVIIGEPNAGKSSLLNRLVGHDRALVSPEPGTTRDFIEERLLLGPHCIRLIDTAGLNSTPDALEKLGMEKTVERAAEADLFLWVLDARAPKLELDSKLRSFLRSEKTIRVYNKLDLLTKAEAGAARTAALDDANGVGAVAVSALTGENLPALSTAIIARADAFRTDSGEEIIAINARHSDALQRTTDQLNRALEQLTTRGELELVASEVRGALDAVGEIAGRIDHERMLDHLFADFCIGK